MAQESKAAVIAAIVANFAIAAVKLAIGLGGSAAMISEGIHSGIDGVNDLLLLFGLRASKRPADALHPFGYGKDLYFWSLIVSMSVFSVGGGVTIIEGMRSILHPAKIQHAGWAYAALLCGLVVDGVSLGYGLVQFRKQNREKAFWKAVKESKDPTTFMVLAEDSAALVGEMIALVSVLLSTRGLLAADGIGSVLIGLLLACMAVSLMVHTRHLLIGESVEEEIDLAIRKLALDRGKFHCVRRSHTMHFGPDDVLVTVDLEFDPKQTAGDLMKAVDEIQVAIREEFPAVKYVYIDPEVAEPTGASKTN